MTETSEDELVSEGALPPEDFHDEIERIVEVAHFPLEVPEDAIDRVSQAAAGLLIEPDLVGEALAALSTGHLVLQGPPGTGKTSLARALCSGFNASAYLVTAHEDWSVFEVIGHHEIRVDTEGSEEVVPVNGFFTEAVIRCAGSVVRHFDNPNEPQATWLLIDELNRAQLDRALGELFTVLGTDEPVPVNLPHQREGNRELVTPSRFRIIATLNSVDRQFVNSLSQGLRRRFSFLTVDTPPPPPAGEEFGSKNPDASLASKEVNLVVARAARRVAERFANDANSKETIEGELVGWMSDSGRAHLEALFHLARDLRYADAEAASPFIPIGTAHLIDVLDLFLTREVLLELSAERGSEVLDWAVAVKIAPLFDSDAIPPAQLQEYATKLEAPFDKQTRRELLQIAAAGLHYVP